MTEITVEEFERDFDSYMDRIESGEKFIVRQPDGRAVVAVPIGDLCEAAKVTGDEELYDMYCDHNDAP